MACGGGPIGPLALAAGYAARGRLQKGAALALAAAAVGVLTALSGVVIELASDLLADLRHGVCVERLPGDTRPVWEATFGGGFRPYDRMRCCGGSSSVDHATEECRALSIIQHSSRKRLAFPLRGARAFGQQLEEPQRSPSRPPFSARPEAEAAQSALLAEADFTGSNGSHTELPLGVGRASALLARARGRATARSARLRERVGADATRVRAHMSHLFGPDPAERWGAESEGAGSRHAEGHIASLAAEEQEVAVNEGVVQTQSESAGSLAPVYEWVPWERALHARGRTVAPLIYVAGSGLLALLAALVTRARPAARGSGIPEVKACVAGFALPRSFRAGTLLAKVTALSLCVGAGLAVGKEGPMIHIGACWGALLALPVARLGRLTDPLSETELICVGAAAGVAAAFGAPLAGVLFAVEELGTTMPAGLRYSTMLCAFGSAVTAALALRWLDLARTQRLTLFEVDYRQAWAPWEALPFCLLGAAGGLAGGAFVLCNEAAHRRRLRAQAEGRLCWYLPKAADGALRRLLQVPAGADCRVLEVVALAVLTGASNYPCALTRMLQNDAIKSLFSQCPEGARMDPVGLCGGAGPFGAAALLGLLRLLLGAAALRFLQTTVTFGALTPAGLFVPSLYMGGCMGRAVGMVLKFAGLPVEPGIYAMVGAGAMLAGVSRLTISLAVVLFELTGGLTYVVPFMLAVLTAKWTADALTDSRSVYDVHAALNGFAKVEQPEDVKLLNASLEDLDEGRLGPEQAEAPEPEAVAAFWGHCGLARGAELTARCLAATAAAGAEPSGSAGFVVLSTGPDGDVEVLGWAKANQMLTLLTAKGAAAPKADRCCLLLPPAPGQRRAPWPGLPCEDLSAGVEARAVARVRGDCPVQTAYCIFSSRPDMRALVSISGTPPVARTITRERFTAHMLPRCLCKQLAPAPRALRVEAKQAPEAATAAERPPKPETP